MSVKFKTKDEELWGRARDLERERQNTESTEGDDIVKSMPSITSAGFICRRI